MYAVDSIVDSRKKTCVSHGSPTSSITKSREASPESTYIIKYIIYFSIYRVIGERGSTSNLHTVRMLEENLIVASECAVVTLTGNHGNAVISSCRAEESSYRRRNNSHMHEPFVIAGCILPTHTTIPTYILYVVC